MDSGSTEPINSVVPDEALINQVVPDEEELVKEGRQARLLRWEVPVKPRIVNWPLAVSVLRH